MCRHCRLFNRITYNVVCDGRSRYAVCIGRISSFRLFCIPSHFLGFLRINTRLIIIIIIISSVDISLHLSERDTYLYNIHKNNYDRVLFFVPVLFILFRNTCVIMTFVSTFARGYVDTRERIRDAAMAAICARYRPPPPSTTTEVCIIWNGFSSE